MNQYGEISMDELKETINKYYDRICMGSDWPEFDHNSFLNKLKFYTDGLDEFKIEKILKNNIIGLIG